MVSIILFQIYQALIIHVEFHVSPEPIYVETEISHKKKELILILLISLIELKYFYFKLEMSESISVSFKKVWICVKTISRRMIENISKIRNIIYKRTKLLRVNFYLYCIFVKILKKIRILGGFSIWNFL